MVGQIFAVLDNTAAFALYSSLGDGVDVIGFLLYAGLLLIGTLPTVGYYLIALGIGPLVVDILRYLETPVPSWLRFLEDIKPRTFVVFGLIVFIIDASSRIAPFMSYLEAGLS